MTSEHARDREMLAPLHDGEFQRIPGIGPGIAQRLQDAGIRTFHHLASLTPEEINGRINGLVGMTAERIAHQDWPGKARQLAQKLAEAEPLSEPEETAARQHYASFMVELLQDETYAVRRTRMVHIQSGAKDSWAGWDSRRLEDWIAGRAAIPAEAETATEPMAVETAAQPIGSQKPSLPLLPEPEIEACQVFSPRGRQPTRFLTASVPLEVHVLLRLKSDVPAQEALCYRASIFARAIGGPRTQVAQVSGTCGTEGPTLLMIPIEGLGEGTYRLDSTVLVYPAFAENPEKEGRFAVADGGIVHVFARETEPVA